MTYDQLRRAVTKARASMGINEIWNQEVKDFLDNFLLERSVKPISDYSRKLLLEALKKAIDQGFTVEEIVAQVAGIMDDLNTKRAFMIVRTELTTAFNVGHMLGAYDSEYEYVKKWVEVKDNRTRYTHRHGTNVDPKTRRVVTGVGGEVVDFAQPFSNGLMYPGDRGDKTRTVPAAEVINCRCVVTFRLKRDANGNPIPKKKPTTYQYGPQGIMRPSLIQALFNGFAAGTIANMINEFINRGE
jgi:hypothetical protein